MKSSQTINGTVKQELRNSGLVLLALLVLAALPSCVQLLQAKRLVDCEYEVTSIENTKLAGVDIQNIKAITDLGLVDAGKLTLALKSDHLPLKFTMNLGIKNPNQQKAALNQLYWVVLIEEREVAEGVITDRVEVPGGGEATMPINIAIDLKAVFASDSTVSLLKSVLGYLGFTASKTKVKLKIKPTFKIGNKLVKSPAFITVPFKV